MEVKWLFQDHTACKRWVWGSRKLLWLRLSAEFSPNTVNEGGRELLFSAVTVPDIQTPPYAACPAEIEHR